MKTYAVKYRCRLCGQDFSDGEFETNPTVLMVINNDTDAIAFADDNLYLLPIQAASVRQHNCDDGSIGFSDFIGIKAI